MIHNNRNIWYHASFDFGTKNKKWKVEIIMNLQIFKYGVITIFKAKECEDR